MQIYIDSDFKCHVENGGTMRAVECEFFDGKCPEYIEGFRYVPAGEAWTRTDGEIFRGEMIAPWKDYAGLVRYQEIYERLLAQQEDMRSALAVLGVSESED